MWRASFPGLARSFRLQGCMKSNPELPFRDGGKGDVVAPWVRPKRNAFSLFETVVRAA